MTKHTPCRRPTPTWNGFDFLPFTQTISDVRVKMQLGRKVAKLVAVPGNLNFPKNVIRQKGKKMENGDESLQNDKMVKLQYNDAAR